MSDLVVHHLGISQSERIVWLCEELELPYTLVRYDRDPATRMAPEAYRALHPIGIAPVVEVDGLMLAESGAIIDYLVMKRGGGRLTLAVDDPGFADWLFWFHFANGTVMPAAMMGIMGSLLGIDGGLMATLSERSTRADALAETHLAKATWFAGESFTTADIMMVFPLTTMRAFAPRDLAAFPNIRAYLARIGERPGYQRAMAACEPGFTPMLA
ncbi:glutathione S-transferase family protein [Sphingomonas bacterium]|uniref:glutathione S-transferase family protein n=1 Tax=Sphingomonas bacterium TaxID=1895847 RepID=UPI0015753E74|nr:glutathione S-transferase [Sphingomonas bacterium]